MEQWVEYQRTISVVLKLAGRTHGQRLYMKHLSQISHSQNILLN